ncbi:MAG TPA: rhomboid family intramembrane serine protease [Saprospiraceae bacterium]|nr:rhomboid family intramembrane serine protease [Saprospiraceae bacterium]
MYALVLRRLSFPIGFVGFIWIIHLLQVILGISFIRLGVFPRAIEGLPGILTSPLIHGSWEHLFYNSISFLILGAIIFWFYPKIALRSFIFLYLLSGLGVWFFAQPNSYHIGASGLVYGMVSLVFWNGIFRRNLKATVLALIILVLYAGYFGGIVPGKEGISWESHLLGAIAGILLAWYYKKDIEEDELPEPVMEEEEKEYFLKRDVFDMTIAEREGREP